MHIVILSIIIAFFACLFLLMAFGLFTISPFAHHLEGSNEREQRRDTPRVR